MSDVPGLDVTETWVVTTACNHCRRDGEYLHYVKEDGDERSLGIGGSNEAMTFATAKEARAMARRIGGKPWRAYAMVNINVRYPDSPAASPDAGE